MTGETAQRSREWARHDRVMPISQLDLYHLAWETPEFSADPYKPCEAARAKHPWLAHCNAGYVVHDLRAIRELLVQDHRLRTAFDSIVDIMQARGTAWGRFAQEQMIALPDKEHGILRRAFAAKFTPRSANLVRPLMRETMTRLLADWAPQRRIDFEEFASYYPISVMTRLIGAPLEAIPGLRSAMEALGLAFSMNPALLPRLEEAMSRLDAFAHELIADRRANRSREGDPDLLEFLLEAGDKEGLTDRQLADMLIFLFVAGYDTSKNVLTYTMRIMLDHPEIYVRCGEDWEYTGKVIEEALRMFTPSSTFRATREDIVHRDVLIPKDTMLFFLLSVAGRISADIDDPHTFDPDRPVEGQPRHVGFGLGKHMCLGQYIARAQLQEGLHLIARHMRNPRLDGEPGWRSFPGVWGIHGLPVVFEPAEIRPTA